MIPKSAFFGAIQIIQYLKTIEIEIKHSIWPYAIHSKSYELIHFLIENHIVPTNQTYEECLKESIKCHFNDIAEYIQENNPLFLYNFIKLDIFLFFLLIFNL